MEFTDNTRTIVVGVGYPPSKYVYDWRRGPDLTPPTPDGKYEMPLDKNGNPRTDLSFGEAHMFLDFIQSHVMPPHVETKLFPHLPLSTSRKALYGHSYGGIFTLNALYTKPTLFNFFIAASPTISWNNHSLVKNQEAAFRARVCPADPPPSLFITWGTSEDELQRQPDESEEAWRNRKSNAEDKDMRDSAQALVARLEDCPSVRSIWTCEFKGEDHGSAAVVGLQRGIYKFLLGTP